jgi:hypothetical protein
LGARRGDGYLLDDNAPEAMAKKHYGSSSLADTVVSQMNEKALGMLIDAL